MERFGKLASNEKPKVGIMPSASKYASIKILEQCLHIINNNNQLNGLKARTKCKI